MGPHERPDFPIDGQRWEILAKICAHPLVIVSGHTGCGKSTQLHDAILFPSGRGLNYDIVVEIEDQAVATNQKTKCAWLRKSNAVGFVTSGDPTYASGSLLRCHDTTWHYSLILKTKVSILELPFF